LVASIAPAGSWRDLNNHKQFGAHDGAILNWWQVTRTVNFQGSPQMAEELEVAFLAANGPGPETIRGLSRGGWKEATGFCDAPAGNLGRKGTDSWAA
jgi:hypothetical protein